MTGLQTALLLLGAGAFNFLVGCWYMHRLNRRWHDRGRSGALDSAWRADVSRRSWSPIRTRRPAPGSPYVDVRRWGWRR